MTAVGFLQGCVLFALALLSLAFLLAVWRIVRGPTLADRVLALDMLVAAGICFIAAIGLRTGFTVVVDIAIALSLVGFLATVAFARFILARGEGEPTPVKRPEADAMRAVEVRP